MKKVKFETPGDVIKFVQDRDIPAVDLKFVDLVGRWHHVTLPGSFLSEDVFKYGIGFDASQNPGYKGVESSDLCAVPDPTTALLDPFWEEPTVSMICNLIEADTLERFVRDPRLICSKAETLLADFLKENKIDGTFIVSPEFEFHLLQNVFYENDDTKSMYLVNVEWNDPEAPIPPSISKGGFRTYGPSGYHSLQPMDEFADLRSQIVIALENAGIGVKYHHHEVGKSGQCEIEVLFDTITRSADNVLWTKYVIRNLSLEYGYNATFMPKPLYGEAGNGMHVHMYVGDIVKNTSAFYDKNGTAMLNDLGRYFMGGVLKHGRSLAAFTNPSTNSYKRLIPGFEAPVSLFYSVGNRSACVRIPKYAQNEREMRFEYRSGDGTSNPYLMFAAIVLAGIDGVKNKIDPGDPINKNLHDISEKELERIDSLPESLEEALVALQEDNAYLLEGGVFDEETLNEWIRIKREYDIEPLNKRPHPFEYSLYFDI